MKYLLLVIVALTGLACDHEDSPAADAAKVKSDAAKVSDAAKPDGGVSDAAKLTDAAKPDALVVVVDAGVVSVPDAQR